MPSLTYASVQDLKVYSLADLEEVEDSKLLKILLIAERDIDRAAGFHYVNDTGRKFNPATMKPTHKKDALMRATCAQAEYRLQMGEGFFIEAQPTNTSGDDTNFSGRLPRIGPKAVEELSDGGLIRRTGRIAHNRNDRSYPSNVQLPLSQTSSNSYEGERD